MASTINNGYNEYEIDHEDASWINHDSKDVYWELIRVVVRV